MEQKTQLNDIVVRPDTITVEERALELEVKKFELEQRRAMMLSKSAFFPDTLKGDVASAVICYDLANRMNLSVMEVAQSVYIIYGRPSFSTEFLVARLNNSGKIKGALITVVSKDKKEAYCEAVDSVSGEKLTGMTVSMAMAKAEGWIDKKGSKWVNMPELMLRKRAQSFFIKEFYPEAKFGFSVKEDVEDAEIIPAEGTAPAKASLNQEYSVDKKTGEITEAEIEEEKPAEKKAPLEDPRKKNPDLLADIDYAAEEGQ